jgi:hypothetical protein
VIVMPGADALRLDAAFEAFAGARTVDVPSIADLSAARAAGVRAATGLFVMLGETHAYPERGWAAALIDAQTGPWVAVVPAFGNANPDGALSWAGLLADYGRWLTGLAASEVDSIPTFNSAYTRSTLIALGPTLDGVLSSSDELARCLRSAGGRFCFVPGARVDHVNVSQPRAWLAERYFSGRMIAITRIERWSLRRRVLYLLGSPLIPVVLLVRLRAPIVLARRKGLLGGRTLVALALGSVVRAVGEAVGYAFGGSTAAEARMADYELHKTRYADRLAGGGHAG